MFRKIGILPGPPALHEHPTLIEAARCATPHGAGWYVFAVDGDAPRQLTDAEDSVVNEFRFGGTKPGVLPDASRSD
jgi:hypothetical protein